MAERSLQNLLRMFMAQIGITNWRNNTGVGWAGRVTRVARSGTFFVEQGSVIIADARPLKAGLCTGSSDVIGITPVLITQQMVGQTVGLFTAVEVKVGKNKATEKQKNFLKVVEQNGGLAGVARCTDDINHIIRKYYV